MRRTRNTKNPIYILLLALLLVVGCNKSPQATATPALATTPVVVTQTGGTIRALGTVRPAQTLQLSFGAGGPIQAVPARLGTAVKTGDLLAKLDTAALQLELENARAQVDIQQAAIDALLNGAGRAQIDRAEATHAQQVAQAQIALRVVQLQLEQARLTSPDEGIALVQVEQARLDLQLAQARAGAPQSEVTVAQINLARAQDALATAQNEYKKALDRPWEPQEIRDALAEGIQQAQWEVQIAQARLDAAQRLQQAHALGLDLLAAQGGTVEEQLAQALDAQAAYTVTLDLFAAQVEQAQQDLQALNDWTNPLLDPALPEAVAQAEARLRQAQLAVEQIEWQMARTEIRAPVDGVVSAIYVHVGEWAAAGAPAVEVLDTTRWLVETRNVSELNIGRIKVGQEAEVQVMALEGVTLRGLVESISPAAVVQQGDTTYTLWIALEPTDLNLKPGMNVQAEILIE